MTTIYSNEDFHSGLDLLSAELTDWFGKQALVPMSADEALVEYADRLDSAEEAYLQHFVARWDAIANDDRMITTTGVEVSIAHVPEDEEDEVEARVVSPAGVGMLKSTMPSIRLTIGGATLDLTWDEAMTLGNALVRESQICEHG